MADFENVKNSLEIQFSETSKGAVKFAICSWVPILHLPQVGSFCTECHLWEGVVNHKKKREKTKKGRLEGRFQTPTPPLSTSGKPGALAGLPAHGLRHAVGLLQGGALLQRLLQPPGPGPRWPQGNAIAILRDLSDFTMRPKKMAKMIQKKLVSGKFGAEMSQSQKFHQTSSRNQNRQQEKRKKLSPVILIRSHVIYVFYM